MESNRYPRDFLIAEIKRVAKIVGEMPTMLQFEEFSEVAAVTVAKRFKGWKNALAAAGFDSSKSRTTYDVQELKDELIRVAAQLGHTPSYDEFDECSNFSASTVLKRLGGSWESAYRSAGLPPPIIGNKHQVVGGWNKGQRKFNIAKDDLFYLYETEGLSATAISVRLGTSKNSVLRALREHGIAIKRLHYSMPRATSIEEFMYRELERRNVPFAKQQVVEGLYLVDAIIMGPRIVIECDGEYWHSLPGAPERDQKKDEVSPEQGVYRASVFRSCAEGRHSVLRPEGCRSTAQSCRCEIAFRELDATLRPIERSEMAAPIAIQSLAFDPVDAGAALAQLSQSPAVFALYGAEAHAEPYIGRTPNLRARLARLLQPSPRHPRRLQLAGRVRRIEWRLTGSEFESLLVQFSLLECVYGPKSLERMHLGHPAFVRFLGGNPYPRIVVTHRPSQREAAWSYGPFQSRAAAERFADEALKLFLLRRCTEELNPNPSHPGCVYSEMKMCLAPCYQGCADERYGEEAAAVERFLATRGESRLAALRAQRDEASARLEFEAAAALHAQVVRVESVRALAPELVRPLSQLRAVILQASANPDEIAVFVYENGRLRGPAAFSTLGMRIQNEQSGSSSLFAHPMAIEPIPEAPVLEAENSEQSEEQIASSKGTGFSPYISGLESSRALQAADKLCFVTGHDFSRAESATESAGALAPEGSLSGNSPAISPPSAATESTLPETAGDQPAKLSRGLLEARMEAALAALAEQADSSSATLRQGYLALVKRWYYRPEVRRTGEIFFPDGEGRWPVKAMLRGAGRVAAKMLASGNRY